MIGWQPKPFIFIHIPKCGGTSIEKSLLPTTTSHSDFDQLSQEERRKFWLPGRGNLQHAKLRKFAEQVPIQAFFKFAFVRNPWDRAVSQIEYLSMNNATSLFSSSDFKERLRVYCRCKVSVWGQDLHACQLDYLEGMDRKLGVDFIGRFETLADDFKTVCGMIGIIPPPELPHIFKSNRSKHYSTYYDDESVKLVQKRFARDIEYFSYRFEEIVPPVESTRIIPQDSKA